MNTVLLPNFIIALAGAMLVAAALSDARRYRIPNALSLGIALLFPVYVTLEGGGGIVWPHNVAVCVGLLGVGYLAFAKGWVGAGDVKLLAAVGLWAGLKHLALLLLVTALSGGVLALALVGWSVWRALRPSKKEEGGVGTEEARAQAIAKTPVPYGVAIALGGLCVLAMLSHPAMQSVANG